MEPTEYGYQSNRPGSKVKEIYAGKVSLARHACGPTALWFGPCSRKAIFCTKNPRAEGAILCEECFASGLREAGEPYDLVIAGDKRPRIAADIARACGQGGHSAAWQGGACSRPAGSPVFTFVLTGVLPLCRWAKRSDISKPMFRRIQPGPVLIL